MDRPRGRPKSGKEHLNVLTLRVSSQDRRHLDRLAEVHAAGNTSDLMRRVISCFLDANPASKWPLNGAPAQKISKAEATRLADLL